MHVPGGAVLEGQNLSHFWGSKTIFDYAYLLVFNSPGGTALH